MYRSSIIMYDSDCIHFFLSSRRRHTKCSRDWSSDVCSSDLRVVVDVRDRGLDERRRRATAADESLVDKGVGGVRLEQSLQRERRFADVHRMQANFNPVEAAEGVRRFREPVANGKATNPRRGYAG